MLPGEPQLVAAHRGGNDRQRCPALTGDAGDHFHHLRSLFDCQNRHAGLDNACLLSGDLGQGVPQHLLMIEADGGDHRDFGKQRVGGVQTAAHAGFQHHPLGLPPGKPFHGQDKSEFKERGMRIPVLDLVTQPGQPLGGFLPVDHALLITDALAKLDEVRRGEKADTGARRVQQAVDKGAHAAFAIGARHMDELLPRCRQLQLAQQPRRVFEPQLDPEQLGAVKPVQLYLFIGFSEHSKADELRSAIRS